MKSFFFSLKASYLFFALLALICGVGSGLTSVDDYYNIFREMNATHLRHCIGLITETFVLPTWLLIFFAVGACLFINTACCTYSQIKILGKLKGHEGEKRRRSIQMTLIHITALVVILLHAMDMTMIERHQPIKLYPGQSAVMGEFTVTVKDVSFVSDLSLIRENGKGRKKKSFAIPAKKFSKEKNLAHIQVTKTTRPVNKGADETVPATELKMMSPVRVGSNYFFLAGFFIAKDSDRIGVEIHHSINPLARIFFLVYGVLLGLLIIRYLTMRKEGV